MFSITPYKHKIVILVLYWITLLFHTLNITDIITLLNLTDGTIKCLITDTAYICMVNVAISISGDSVQPLAKVQSDQSLLCRHKERLCSYM